MDADGRRVGHVVVGVGLVALAVLAVVLFVAGAQKNAQISRLRQSGVIVHVTVTGCLGLMGGSGSNLVGYECKGTFTIDGHRYNEAIPGNAFHPPGATLRDVAVPDDPALVSTIQGVATSHPSGRVFVLPTILLVILGLLVGAVDVRRRRVRRSSPPEAPVTAVAQPDGRTLRSPRADPAAAGKPAPTARRPP